MEWAVPRARIGAAFSSLLAKWVLVPLLGVRRVLGRSGAPSLERLIWSTVWSAQSGAPGLEYQVVLPGVRTETSKIPQPQEGVKWEKSMIRANEVLSNTIGGYLWYPAWVFWDHKTGSQAGLRRGIVRFYTRSCPGGMGKVDDSPTSGGNS